MRKLTTFSLASLIISLVLLAVLTAGCGSSSQFHTTVKTLWGEDIGPRYRTLVNESPRYDDESRADILGGADMLDAAIADEGEKHQGATQPAGR